MFSVKFELSFSNGTLEVFYDHWHVLCAENSALDQKEYTIKNEFDLGNAWFGIHAMLWKYAHFRNTKIVSLDETYKRIYMNAHTHGVWAETQ